MRILIVTQYFWPENFRINELCEEFTNLEHDITVLTGYPNYPKGEIYKEFLKDTLSLFLKDIEKIKKLIEDEKYSKIFRLLKRTKEIRNSIIKKRI